MRRRQFIAGLGSVRGAPGLKTQPASAQSCPLRLLYDFANAPLIAAICGPRRSRLDSKYGVCFRACLAFAPSYIASELQLAGKTQRTQETTINFVLEDGHPNVGDARRLFDLFKADALPEWRHVVGAFDVSKKNSPGAQAADFLAYCVYRVELLEHGARPSEIERSSYVADTPLVANTYPRNPLPQSGPMLFRIPVSQDVLRSLKDDMFALDVERRGHAPRSPQGVTQYPHRTGNPHTR
jgi:hypothetical protein